METSHGEVFKYGDKSAKSKEIKYLDLFLGLVPRRVEKSGEHGEHAPGTPKVFPRNTHGKNLSKRGLKHDFMTF